MFAREGKLEELQLKLESKYAAKLDDSAESNGGTVGADGDAPIDDGSDDVIVAPIGGVRENGALLGAVGKCSGEDAAAASLFDDSDTELSDAMTPRVASPRDVGIV